MKKELGVMLVAIFFAISTIVISVIFITKMDNQILVLKKDLDECHQAYREHMSKCSFISRDMIQKQNGRHILLYHPQNTNIK